MLSAPRTTAAQRRLRLEHFEPRRLLTTYANIIGEDGDLTEGSDGGRLQVSLMADPATTAPIVVSFTLPGDLTAAVTSLTFAAGATCEAQSITLTAVDDTVYEGAEDAVATLIAHPTTPLVYTLGDPLTATIDIAENDVQPIVTIAASDAQAEETGTNDGEFTIARTGPTTNALVVAYTVGGTATPGVDYPSLSGTITIAAGSSNATIAIDPTDDTQKEPAEQIVVTLTVPATPIYAVGTPSSATVTIAASDNVAPTITIDGIDPGETVVANNKIDEGEQFFVEGTVVDPDNTPTVTVRADLNFDGDTTDFGEAVVATLTPDPLTPGTFSYTATLGPIPDDGPSNVWGNNTASDNLNVTAEVDDGDGGTDSDSATAVIYNVRPRSNGAATASLTYDAQGALTGLEAGMAFTDPGLADWHRVNVAAPSGSSTIDLPFGDRSFTLTQTLAAGQTLSDLLPLRVNVRDDDVDNQHLTINPARYPGEYDTLVTGNLSANVSDPDGAQLVFTSLSTSPHGVLNLNPNGQFEFDPDPNFFAGTTVMLPILVTTPNGWARFAIFDLTIGLTAPLLGHEHANASFWISSTGIGDPADTFVTRVPLGGPVPFSPIGAGAGGSDANVSQVWWVNPQMPVSTMTDEVLSHAHAAYNSPPPPPLPVLGGTMTADSTNLLPEGVFQYAPSAESDITANLFAGVPTGYTHSAARYTVSTTGPGGATGVVPINMLLHVNTGAIGLPNPGFQVDRVGAVPHWVYAEITTIPNGMGLPVPGSGTYIFGTFANGDWTWAQQIDAPTGADVFFTGFGQPTTNGFSLNFTIATSAGVPIGDDVIVTTALGWDRELPALLAGLAAPTGNGAFVAAP